jgi:hypothetical protein
MIELSKLWSVDMMFMFGEKPEISLRGSYFSIRDCRTLL